MTIQYTKCETNYTTERRKNNTEQNFPNPIKYKQLMQCIS